MTDQDTPSDADAVPTVDDVLSAAQHLVREANKVLQSNKFSISLPTYQQIKEAGRTFPIFHPPVLHNALLRLTDGHTQLHGLMARLPPDTLEAHSETITEADNLCRKAVLHALKDIMHKDTLGWIGKLFSEGVDRSTSTAPTRSR